MGSGYAWILPTAIGAGWLLSWWRTRRIRWGLLSVATVVSVLCAAFGIRTYGRPVSPEDLHCSSAFACVGRHPVYWIMTGMTGFGCCLVLLLVTAVAEIVIWLDDRASPESPR
ncbi:hypothetical protein ACTAF0_03685 [Streptomyces murinus]|uniref:hypothetical protein n=1 Tax=Streptomyces murinus TaxID=33900 RepID=UPI003F45A0DB